MRLMPVDFQSHSLGQAVQRKRARSAGQLECICKLFDYCITPGLEEGYQAGNAFRAGLGGGVF